MPDIKLFSIQNDVKEVVSSPAALERELQTLIEKNMPAFFGVTFLESEYTTSNGGRIDSLGIDENNCPVIFEYKRSSNENVINQGLFYLDWLLDHKAEFELLVMKKLGKERSDQLDWSIPRLICVAGNFTKYDEHAVNQINRNIDLVRYILYRKELILFELINAKTASVSKGSPQKVPKDKGSGKQVYKTFDEQLASADKSIQMLYASVKGYILSLGDDLSENVLKFYVAFKKMKNVICVEVSSKQILIYLKLNPDDISLEEGFSRDVRGVGHWSTGDVQLTIRTSDDFEKAKPLIERAYEEN